MNNENTSKKISKENGKKFSVGSWIQTGSPIVSEIMSNSGFDWIAARWVSLYLW